MLQTVLTTFMFLISSPAVSEVVTDCDQWLTTTENAVVASMPLSELMVAGVAHIEFSPTTLQMLMNESAKLITIGPSESDWDVPRFEAAGASYRENHESVSEDIIQKLRESLPAYNWSFEQGNASGKGQGAIPAGRKTMMAHPLKYIEQWHRDSYDPKSYDLFEQNRFEDFIFRVIVAFPTMDVPSVLTLPERGPLMGKIVQGPRGAAVGFLRDIIWHSSPQFEGWFRSIYIMDFRGVKRVAN